MKIHASGPIFHSNCLVLMAAGFVGPVFLLVPFCVGPGFVWVSGFCWSRFFLLSRALLVPGFCCGCPFVAGPVFCLVPGFVGPFCFGPGCCLGRFVLVRFFVGILPRPPKKTDLVNNFRLTVDWPKTEASTSSYGRF